MRICRFSPPTTLASPTPVTICRRFFSVFSSQVVRVRCDTWLN
jgi:hypothetical protein